MPRKLATPVADWAARFGHHRAGGRGEVEHVTAAVSVDGAADAAAGVQAKTSAPPPPLRFSMPLKWTPATVLSGAGHVPHGRGRGRRGIRPALPVLDPTRAKPSTVPPVTVTFQVLAVLAPTTTPVAAALPRSGDAVEVATPVRLRAQVDEDGTGVAAVVEHVAAPAALQGAAHEGLEWTWNVHLVAARWVLERLVAECCRSCPGRYRRATSR